jgi:hypothetical protein
MSCVVLSETASGDTERMLGTATYVKVCPVEMKSMLLGETIMSTTDGEFAGAAHERNHPCTFAFTNVIDDDAVFSPKRHFQSP